MTTTTNPSGAALLFLFSHGAGAGIHSDHCQRWIARLGEIAPVVPLQYAYLHDGRRRPPPRLPILIAEHAARFRDLRAQHPDAVIVMVGHSMGGRVACHASLEADINAAALVCLSYPLIAAGPKRTRRDHVLRQVRVPILFVAGSKDAMCPVADLRALAAAAMHARAQIHVVDGAGHDLRPKARAPPAAEARCLDAIRKFVMEL